MLSQLRRFVVFAALAALLTLIPVAPGAAQATGCPDDWDCDGVPDMQDQYPDDPNESRDSDGDTIGDNADNCPTQPSPGLNGVQFADLDGDGKGDPCDDDRDGDGVANDRDAFPDDATRKWHQPTDWADYNECERQYYDKHGTLRDSDCDGDGVKLQADSCPKYGPAYGHAPSDSNGCKDALGPEGDNDYDGVLNGQDRCPSQGAGDGGLDATGCPVARDSDGDGWADEKDGCPDEPANEHNRWPNGCPGKAPFAEKDTPPASGPSCTQKMPCIVLERKGLSEKQSGGYQDPDATMRVTIARDAHGVPARVVGVQLRNVDSHCMKFGTSYNDWTRTPGPEVSVDLGPLALKKGIQRHANYNSTVFRFDPIKPIRTIKGEPYELGFYMEKDDDAREAQLSISSVGNWTDDHCSIDINGYNDRLTRSKSADTNAAEKKAVKKAVKKCKKKPADTKKQRRKRAKCLKNARA